MDLTFQVPMQCCCLQHRTLLLSPVTSTAGYCFCFGFIPSVFLELFLHLSPVAYWAPMDLGSSSFSILSFCLFVLFMGFSRQEYWSGVPFPSPVDHILSVWQIPISIPKKGNAKECSNYRTIALISHASKAMLKILQARLQQYMNCELPDVQAGSRKGRGTRDQIANICWIMEKAREFQKNIYFCFTDSAKAFDSVDHNKLWKILKEMGIPDHLICLLRNLYAGQEGWQWGDTPHPR